VVLSNAELALRSGFEKRLQVFEMKENIEVDKWYLPIRGLVPIYYGLEALPTFDVKKDDLGAQCQDRPFSGNVVV